MIRDDLTRPLKGIPGVCLLHEHGVCRDQGGWDDLGGNYLPWTEDAVSF